MAGANIFHLHIPKTAGTSLREAFHRAKMNVLPIGRGFAFDPQSHADVDLFSGHAGFRAVDASPALRDKVVTILRDPYERVLSYYHHLIMVHDAGIEISDRTQLAAKYELYEFLAIKDHTHLLADVYNAMTWELVWDVEPEARMIYRREQPRLTDADLVERAKANLASFLVVGLQTNVPAFEAEVQRRTGVKLKLHAENVNPSRPLIGSIEAETKRRMRGWIEMDIAI